MSRYYHAGAMDARTNDVMWSNHTRRSASRAERESVRMARKTGRIPVVESWDSSHGLVPGDADVVCDAYIVESE